MALALPELTGGKISSTLKMTLYFPDKSKDGTHVWNIEQYVIDCLHLVAKLAGGATRIPAQGVWRNRKTGKLILENTVLIYAYISDFPNFLKEIEKIKKFALDYGVKTKQEAVFIEFAGEVSGGFQARAYEFKI